MRRLVLALLGATAMAVSANAADMPVKAPIVKAPVAVPYNWTGAYVGLFAGGAFAGNASSPDPTSSSAPFIGCYSCASVNTYRVGSGFTGGLTLGYNWQSAASPLVLGVEGEFGYLHARGSNPYSNPAFPSASEMVATTTEGDWFGTATLRFGYAWNNFLAYGKVGVAAVREQVSAIDATASVINPGLLNASASSTTWGLAVGGGLEWAWSKQWSLKAEYLYLGVNKTINACGVDTAAASAGFGATFCSAMSVPAVHTAKVGLNYHFDLWK